MENKKVNYEMGKMWKWVSQHLHEKSPKKNHHYSQGSVPRLKSQVF